MLRYNTMIQAALDVGTPEEASKVLHAIAGDLNYASKVLEMTPTKMASELTKLATGQVKVPSEAPKPIVPLGRRGESHEQVDPTDKDRADNLSTAEWMRRREVQVRERGLQ
jgi:hypothetical protein